MSQFLELGSTPKPPTAPTKGPEDYLSPEERQFFQRFLSFPEDFPPKFKSWLVDYMAVNIPQIPISQVVGYQQTTAKNATVSTSQSTASATYTNLATVGPTISGIADGSYIVWFGCHVDIDADVQAAMSISVNGAAAADSDRIDAGVDGLSGDQVRMTQSRAVVYNLANSGNNTLQAKYRRLAGASNATFSNRWMIALRVGA